MRKMLLTAAAAAALAFVAASPAAAVNFVGTDTVSAYPYGGPNSNSGLEIGISDPSDLNFNLNNVGDSTGFISLFTIYTPETTIQSDDLNDQPITLTFNFTQPVPGGSGGFTGETDGIQKGFFLGRFFIPTGGVGELRWDSTSTVIALGSGHKLQVDLKHQTQQFNEGFFLGDLNEGVHHGANVKANFTLTAIPEPTTWALMIGGFGLAGAAMRRRRALALA